MVTRDEQRERVVHLLCENILKTGLSQTSLRQLAAAANISDRMLLYYFKDKSEVIATALIAIAGKVANQLAVAIPENANLEAHELIARAAILTQSSDMRPFMRLWIEIVAAASRDERPYSAISQQIALGFMDWIEARLSGDPCEAKHAVAAMILAIIDGLAVLDLCAGQEQSQLAINTLMRVSFK
jgi:AcrR family transcriptional regulator